MSNILVIRMREVGDVATIGIAALNHIKRDNPDANIHFLTHREGIELSNLVDPEIHVMSLENDKWPDNIILAIEAFLGVAEQIVGIKFSQIINLDTAFMPCFLARFLKDAGEPVAGNTISISVQSLFSQLQNQSLQPEYVNNEAQYLRSSFFGMFKWHTQWWTSENIPDKGYPEFYLKECCGFSDIDFSIRHLVSDEMVTSGNKTVYLALNDVNRCYSYLEDLEQELTKKGHRVFVDNQSDSLIKRLSKIKSSDLVVSYANASFSYANCLERKTLLIPGELDPKILMPDFATEQSDDTLEATELADSIESIFSELEASS